MIRYEFTGRSPGQSNMDMDRRSAEECLSGRDEPHVRLYGWTAPTISLGWNQSPALLNLALARFHGVDVVRRPTGGGAILHSDELTYCVTLPLGGRTPSSLYGRISRALVHGLQLMGIVAEEVRWQTASERLHPYHRETLCFSGVARNEIHVDGRKLIGSAQRVYRDGAGRAVLLQHGSLLLSEAHARLPVYLRGIQGKDALRRSSELLIRSTSVGQILNRKVTMEEAAISLRGGFESTAWKFEPSLSGITAGSEEVFA